MSSFSHVYLQHDFTITQGADWQSHPILFVSSTSTGYADLTGCTFRGQARRTRNATGDPAFSFTFDLDTTDSDAQFARARLAASVSAAVTPLGDNVRDKNSVFYYDFEVVDADGKITVFMSGRIWMLRNVTR